MASKDVVHLTDSNFSSEVLEAGSPVLVDFWAPFCGPCRAMAPTIEELAREFSGRLKVAKLNIDEVPEIARRYDVRSIPTLAVFQDGKIVQGLIGAAPKARLAAMLEEALRAQDAQAAG